MNDDLRIDGPPDAATTIVLAHGAGAGMDHEFLATFAQGLAAVGLRVIRFEFPYMAARRRGERRPPDRLPVLQQRFADVAAQGGPPTALVLAGKSMGGRVATTIADDLGVAGVVAIGYPFHPPRQPEQLRTAHLVNLRTKTLILQGERDPFGTRAEVAGYSLSAAIAIEWFADGDHSLVPRKSSGHTAASHLRRALDSAAAFVRCVTG
ncbi:MAG: alpha/beta hydrolase [Planctomycetes bacterium]|nr:alpha/beta hydrolase [Planctomycetota bacterium]